VLLEAVERRAKILAFAQGHHARTGAALPVLALEEGVLRMVLRQL